jgi:mannitol/fructose-specific phosphotransferase system IIA component (Ntr-type)
MKLGDYLKPQCVVILQGTTKEEALSELIDVMVENGAPGKAQLTEAVWRREEMMSTGIGAGLAIPHVRMGGLKAALIAVGVSHEGLADYESLDGEPVHIVVLIAAPQGQHETYIRLLALVADVLKQKPLREQILQAEDSETIYRVLTESQP